MPTDAELSELNDAVKTLRRMNGVLPESWKEPLLAILRVYANDAALRAIKGSQYSSPAYDNVLELARQINK